VCDAAAGSDLRLTVAGRASESGHEKLTDAKKPWKCLRSCLVSSKDASESDLTRTSPLSVAAVSVVVAINLNPDRAPARDSDSESRSTKFKF
jgi:hypothetical protein